MILVDQVGVNRVSGEGESTHRDIVRQLRLQAANYVGIELPLEARLPSGDGLQHERYFKRCTMVTSVLAGSGVGSP